MQYTRTVLGYENRAGILGGIEDEISKKELAGGKISLNGRIRNSFYVTLSSGKLFYNFPEDMYCAWHKVEEDVSPETLSKYMDDYIHNDLNGDSGQCCSKVFHPRIVLTEKTWRTIPSIINPKKNGIVYRHAIKMKRSHRLYRTSDAWDKREKYQVMTTCRVPGKDTLRIRYDLKEPVETVPVG